MALALATTFVSGFVILNSFYTWPKLLPVAFLFVLPGYLFTDRFSSVRADWRVGALVGAAAGFAMLCHGGSAFALLGIALTLLCLRRLSSLRFLLAGALVAGFLYFPWMLYQKYYDPPGDRLLKMHLISCATSPAWRRHSRFLATRCHHRRNFFHRGPDTSGGRGGFLAKFNVPYLVLIDRHPRLGPAGVIAMRYASAPTLGGVSASLLALVVHCHNAGRGFGERERKKRLANSEKSDYRRTVGATPAPAPNRQSNLPHPQFPPKSSPSHRSGRWPFGPFPHRGVRHARRMRDQRFDSAQRLAHGAHAHPFQQPLGVGERAGLKGDHGAKARHLPARQLVLRMAFQSGIENLLHLAMAAEKSAITRRSRRAASCGRPVSSRRAAPANTRTAT